MDHKAKRAEKPGSDRERFEEGRRRLRERALLLYQRVGSTPSQQLRWVLGFTERNLDLLLPEERSALGQDLLFLPALTLLAEFPEEGRPPGGWPMGPPLGEKALRDIQQRVYQGLWGLVAHPPLWWKLPQGQPRLIRVSPPGAKATRFTLAWANVHTPADAIIMSIVTLINQAGERLRGCLYCGKPFLANKRQVYCSPSCSQKKRNERKK